MLDIFIHKPAHPPWTEFERIDCVFMRLLNLVQEAIIIEKSTDKQTEGSLRLRSL